MARPHLAAAAAEPERNVLTVPEAAKRLGMSPAFVYRLVRQHQLASITIGRNRRIYEDSLDAFIDAHTVPALETAPATVQRPARRRAR
jgi:excisionase family DNA binding protein